ncbi:MAG: coenzyme F420-0:L-glutamate ligase, partial [Clostridium celatum]|nr:coenzyme F420-0:L-glutamate ligase [Clostridium celatum]
GDRIEDIVVESVLKASESEGFTINDKDIVTVTESVVARAQGNYASIDNIAKDVKSKFGDDTIGVIFPILSRNRFAICLRGIAKAAKKIVLMLSYPSDEVGNHLVDLDMLDDKGVNPWTDVLTEQDFRNLFGYNKHPFTGVDYIDYYKSLIEEYGVECEVIFSNNPKTILNYTKSVLTCDIHTRFRTKKILKANGGEKIYSLDNILCESIDGSGYNESFGLLGSNKSTEETVKLFPRNCQPVVDNIQAILKEKTGKDVEVMIYGDGAFKDPVGKIWELADPVVSPAYTSGLNGTPNEIKLKYLADNNFADLKGEELKKAISEYIKNKESDLVGAMESQGTTPRRLTDLIGSLSDLTSGSGDKGTPIIFIQGYFDNYTK